MSADTYDGPIEVGMTFLWEPFLPHATEHVKVVLFDTTTDPGERWIVTRSWVPASKIDGDYAGEMVWNEEGRFREAVLFVPPREVRR